jgi:predicted transcriptional regulator
LPLVGEGEEVAYNPRDVSRGDFATVVEVLGNPVRRQIIRKLSEGPDYALRLSNELNIHQQLAAKHLDVIRKAELVDIVRQKGDKGADKNVFTLNKFYSLQIDFSPSMYSESLISFNNPDRWVLADNYMERLEEEVEELSEESGVDRINPLSQIVQAVDEELEGLEKRRARLLYVRNLAMNAGNQAMEEMDRRKRQVLRYVIDHGQASIEGLSKYLQFREETVRNIVGDLEREDLVNRMGNTVYRVEPV